MGGVANAQQSLLSIVAALLSASIVWLDIHNYGCLGEKEKKGEVVLSTFSVYLREVSHDIVDYYTESCGIVGSALDKVTAHVCVLVEGC